MARLRRALPLFLLSTFFIAAAYPNPSTAADDQRYSLELAKLMVSILGFAGTIITIWMAIRQYRRAEQWKRAEFVAKEVKDFENSPMVRNALSMIDWGVRRINLRLKKIQTMPI